MNGIDILIAAPIIYGIVRGIVRGFVKEAISVVAVVAALILAKLNYGWLSNFFIGHYDWNPVPSQTTAFLIIFFAVALVLNLIGILLTKLLKAINLNVFNTIFGALFGAIKWVFIVSIVLNGILLLNQFYPFITIEYIDGSLLLKPISKITSTIWDGIVQITSSAM